MAPQEEASAADVGGKSAEHKEAGEQSLAPSDQEERVDASSSSVPPMVAIAQEEARMLASSSSRPQLGPIIVMEPKVDCGLCGDSIRDREHRIMVAAGTKSPRFSCAVCGATEYSWCSKCFFKWRPGFCKVVEIPEQSTRNAGHKWLCCACVDDGMNEYEKAFCFLLSRDELLHMKKVAAFLDKNPLPLAEVMTKQQIRIPSR